MSSETKQTTSPTTIILQMLGTAANEAWQDRRTDFRLPFFRPVSIRMNGQFYSAFSRDISPSSIGLIHNMELPEGEVEITIPINEHETGELRARIVRCEPSGRGWYTSGAEFIEVNFASLYA